MITDANGVIEYVNPQFSIDSGYSPAEVIGQSSRLLSSGLDCDAVFEALWQDLSQGKPWVGELINHDKQGNIFWEEAHFAPVSDEQNRIAHYVAIKLNITDRKENEAKLLHMALYDPLTDLPNRGLLNDRLRQSMEAARGNQHQIALMFVDLDYFKQINDTHGHDVGDLVLKQTAHRMKRQLRGSDTIARIGGDEFVALLHDIREVDESLTVAEKLLLALREPIEIYDLRLTVTCSSGIALYPRHAPDEIALYRHADEALYSAKNAGRNGVRMYDAKAPSRNNLNSRLLAAEIARLEPIVPLTMELITFDGECREFLVGDFDACGIVPIIPLGLDAQSFGGRRVADQVDDDLPADQGTAAPVLRDVTEHPMLDFVPFAGAGRKVTDLDQHAQFVSELLQLNFPQAHAVAVTATAVGGDQQAPRRRVEWLAHLVPPPADALDGEGRRVVRNADAHPALVGAHVIHPIGRHFSQWRVNEVIDAPILRVAFGLPLASTILEVPNQFLLFGIHGDHGVADGLILRGGRGNVAELRVTISLVAPFARLAGRLQAVIQLGQQITDGPLAHRMTLRHQFLGQARRTLTGPAQRRPRITARRRVDQRIQGAQKRRIFRRQFLAPTSLGPNTAPPRGHRLPTRWRHRQLAQTGIDRRTRQTHRTRYGTDAPMAEGTRLNRCPQPQRGFVQTARKRLKFLLNHLGGVHAPSVSTDPALFKLFLLGS